MCKSRRTPSLAGAESVRLTNYRNYRSLFRWRLAPGFNVLAGPNAPGGRPTSWKPLPSSRRPGFLRGQREYEAISDGESRALVESRPVRSKNDLGNQAWSEGTRKKALPQTAWGLPRASDLIGRMPACMHNELGSSHLLKESQATEECFWTSTSALCILATYATSRLTSELSNNATP